MQRRTLRKTIKYSVIATLIVVVFVLSIYEFRNLVSGPIIKINSPDNYLVTDQPTIKISGNIKNAVLTSINDNPIFIDTEGNFNQIYLVAQGLNHIKVYAKDRFDKEDMVILTVVGKK